MSEPSMSEPSTSEPSTSELSALLVTSADRRRRARARLMAGAAVAVLAAGSFAGLSQGYAETLFAPGGSVGARSPAQPAATPGFADLVEAVKPAVVSVRVKAKAEGVADAGFGQGDASGANPFEGTPFEKFFGAPGGRDFGQQFQRRFGGQDNSRGSSPQRPLVQGQGSGFFVSADGYIVTNDHVVKNATSVEVVTDDGRTLQAKVVGTDPKTDLALIKVDGSGFPFVKLATQTPRIGEWVVAMGNPFGLGGSVTAGIVSAQGRDIGSGPYDDYLQIDAPVNRGNSGGPTFNLKGEVVGVNTAIYSPSGGSVGIAFDIPSGTVASVIPQLQEHGKVARGWLGVQIQPVTQAIADSLGLKQAGGALVSEPQAGSPAAKAGLKSGDVITGVDAIQIKDARALARTIAALGPDKKVALKIWRDGKEQTVDLTLGALSEEKTQKASVEDRGGALDGLGLSLAPASAAIGPNQKGLAVVGVEPDGKAADLGLREGDVILRANGKPVASVADLTGAMAEAKAAGRKATLLLVKRDQNERFVAAPNVG